MFRDKNGGIYLSSASLLVTTWFSFDRTLDSKDADHAGKVSKLLEPSDKLYDFIATRSFSGTIASDALQSSETSQPVARSRTCFAICQSRPNTRADSRDCSQRSFCVRILHSEASIVSQPSCPNQGNSRVLRSNGQGIYWFYRHGTRKETLVLLFLRVSKRS
jgi:hypothetical protein